MMTRRPDLDMAELRRRRAAEPRRGLSAAWTFIVLTLLVVLLAGAVAPAIADLLALARQVEGAL